MGLFYVIETQQGTFNHHVDPAPGDRCWRRAQRCVEMALDAAGYFCRTSGSVGRAWADVMESTTLI